MPVFSSMTAAATLSVFPVRTAWPRSLWSGGGETMDDDYGVEGFALAPYELRCCQRTSSLDELRYDWPQAFGRFAITVMNPGADDVPESLLTALSASCRCDARPGASAR